MAIRFRGNIVTVTSPWLIRLAWGKRRVSSKAAPGTEAYPKEVSAGWRMWRAWIWRRQIIDRREYVVISTDPERGHGARYAKELANRRAAEVAAAAKAEMTSRIDALQEKRRVARAQKDFEKADAIRDEIEAAGFVVNDVALEKINTPQKEGE